LQHRPISASFVHTYIYIYKYIPDKINKCARYNYVHVQDWDWSCRVWWSKIDVESERPVIKSSEHLGNNVHVGQLSANTSRVQPTPKEHYYTYSSNYSSSILFYEAKPTNHALMRKAHTVQLYIASIRFRT